MTYVPLTGVPNYQGVLGIDDNDDTNIASHAASIINTHGLGATWFQKYIIRGRTFSAIPAGQACWFAEDFSDIARWHQTAGLAAMTAVTTTLGGVAQIVTDIGPPLTTAVLAPGAAAFGTPTVCDGHGRFYMASRMRVPTGTPADGLAIFGITDGAAPILVGYSGTTSVAKWMLFGAGTSALSTVNLDANWHDIEVWCDATNYYLSVDAETPVVMPPAAAPATQMNPYVQVVSGAAVAVTGQYDKALWIFPQAS
jgi:hypothetical protein